MYAVHVHARARMPVGMGPAGLVPCRASACRAKKGIHPTWYEQAPVLCEGKQVLTVSGTIPRYQVETWSGNHSLWQGRAAVTKKEAEAVQKFRQKHGNFLMGTYDQQAPGEEAAPASSLGPTGKKKAVGASAPPGKGRRRR
ncbi:hypothetical protein H632_c2674p0 [Helicosporidium sp. ATCC 50920]|nr:hypothetical protein H632_c2674p0 [Helicosporidium sp. ATCC 50920]|eukprot:KDD72974.1 hypothetical protein H632_c2674p0 [Helicosporidium sp. ATCC 50920]